MRLVKHLALLLLLVQAPSAEALAEQPVWIDTDLAIGEPFRDVDDGLTLLLALASPEVGLRGLSVVFGNVGDLDAIYGRATEIVARFGPPGLAVYRGARSASDLGTETEATRALAQALRRERLTILALGPLTTVATVLARHPELIGQAERVIAVAGRRWGQPFRPGKGWVSLPDLNFESDPAAFRVLLETGVPVTFLPFEVGNQVWITVTDLNRLGQAGQAARWFANRSGSWMELWVHGLGVVGFNPFDSLAVAFLLTPEHFHCKRGVPAVIRIAPDDRWWARLLGRQKPYLLVSREYHSSFSVDYCDGVDARTKAAILERLSALDRPVPGPGGAAQ